ncbi:MAG: glycosyltransferase family 4 protein [Endomicrobiaceae bacterium]|nr:glycosyltransferase family 4 protein [Endomicrobiaceae bacterium]
MKKIKVCIIVTKLELGGAQKVAIDLCKKLDKNKFETFMICGLGGILDNETANEIKIYFVKDLIRQLNPFKDFKAGLEIYKILKKERPDIVHTHSSKAGILGRCSAFAAGIKNIIHTIHGFPFNGTQSFLKRNLYIMLEKFCAKISKILIPVSTENIKKGLSYGIGKEIQYRYVRLGIDIENFKKIKGTPSLKRELNLKDTDIFVTTIGPFKPQKNLEDFINVANIIVNKNSNYKFIITGDGIERKKLENLIKNFNLKNNVYLLGWRRDISNILNSSDFFIMTSLWEGLPISTIEAMSCGLVPIVNDVDGQREIIKDNENGFLIKPYDTKATADKILFLAENPDIKNKMSLNARQTINETFSIDYMIKQHENIYLELTGINE